MLKLGGLLVTIALVPLCTRRLAACGFDLIAAYQLPAIGSHCRPSGSCVYAQVARRRAVRGDEAFQFEGGGWDEQTSAVELPLLPVDVSG